MKSLMRNALLGAAGLVALSCGPRGQLDGGHGHSAVQANHDS